MPPKHDFEDDELVGLSDDERAALEDDEADAAPPTGEDDEDADGDDEQDDEASTGEDDEDDEGEGDEVDAAGAEGDADPGVTPPAAPREEAPSEFQPQFTAAVPEDLAARLEGVSQRFGELQQKLEDGEISVADYVVQNQALVDERMALKLAEEQAKWADAQNKNVEAQRWKWDVDRFYESEAAKIYKDPILGGALDMALRQLVSEPANEKRSGAWLLAEADRLVRERMSLGSTQRPNRARKDDRHPDLSSVPKTLANLPAAELAETGADEFAYLDKLTGMALEDAVSRMSEEQKERWERA
ncbi:hypothetical protein [Thauera sp.]|uniref:hypothetical protein n=1 Tax=Thauera sp. TaxID=1905334 RepID=UPI002B9639D7|nr:hypothetical protein [Thauera sp.]HRO35366.1 hypothetical protein [Thauera sp.]